MLDPTYRDSHELSMSRGISEITYDSWYGRREPINTNSGAPEAYDRRPDSPFGKCGLDISPLHPVVIGNSTGLGTRLGSQSLYDKVLLGIGQEACRRRTVGHEEPHQD